MFKLAIVVTVLALANFAQAFTNGTLLPAYLCGLSTDGYPKSLGGVLAYFQEPGAALTVANYHNQNATTAQMGVITVKSTMAAIIPGQPFPITLQTLGMDPNQNIDGALIWAVDGNGNRVGDFIAYGANMQKFPQCLGSAVHNQVLSNNNMYEGLVWHAPEIHSSTIIFKGLAVTDTGFGFHNTTFPVQGWTSGTYPTILTNQKVLKCKPKMWVTSSKAPVATTPAMLYATTPVYGYAAPTHMMTATAAAVANYVTPVKTPAYGTPAPPVYGYGAVPTPMMTATAAAVANYVTPVKTPAYGAYGAY